MNYEWLEMQREAERHQAIEQYLRRNLAQDVYGSSSPRQGGSPYAGSPYAGSGAGGSVARSPYAGNYDMVQTPASANVTHMPLTQADKVRMTFTDLDYNHNGVVELDEFIRGCTEMKLGLSEPTINDLFNKARGNKTSGDLTEPEWYRFVIQYPMLLDALYHRFRAARNAEREAEAARSARERLNDRADALRKEVDSASRAYDDAAEKAATDERAYQDAEDKVKESSAAHKDAVQGVQDAFRERQEKEKQVAAEWEATRAQRIAAAEASRDADVAQRRLDAAEEREKWALQALEAARQEKEQAQADLDAAKARQQEVKPAGEDPEIVLGEADRKVADAQRAEYEKGIAAAEDGARADRLRWAKDEQDRVKAGAEARMNRAKDALAEADKACEENDDRLRDAENVKENGVMVDEKENQLVEQEIRLKEQRETLEEKEQTLARECNEYTTRISPMRERPYSSPAHHGSPYTTPTKGY
eukprot:TRINITY_DN24785_c0_g2_i1.p1 TRINITY_DN24785_c0_g2~~TRINITY_DN24785_c0_g2_i1.p1  ORF type:complete len:475 (+),score=198.17 TRINITY_DN24785_c0_g2_i1:49-1473(+)